MLKIIFYSLTLIFGAQSLANSAHAHHSYAGYNREESFELNGTIVDIQWSNPHILLVVNNGFENIRVEWVTINGAEKTGVNPNQFTIGDPITVIGSRNTNPEIHTMTLVKELLMSEKNWHWISPSLTRTP